MPGIAMEAEVNVIRLIEIQGPNRCNSLFSKGGVCSGMHLKFGIQTQKIEKKSD